MQKRLESPVPLQPTAAEPVVLEVRLEPTAPEVPVVLEAVVQAVLPQAVGSVRRWVVSAEPVVPEAVAEQLVPAVRPAPMVRRELAEPAGLLELAEPVVPAARLAPEEQVVVELVHQIALHHSVVEAKVALLGAVESARQPVVAVAVAVAVAAAEQRHQPEGQEV